VSVGHFMQIEVMISGSISKYPAQWISST